jgi:acyl-[acyl-carrier-protein] desaturase
MELDPEGTILSFADMMKKQMVMPAHMMKDGESPTLFMDYSEVRLFLRMLDFLI